MILTTRSRTSLASSSDSGQLLRTKYLRIFFMRSSCFLSATSRSEESHKRNRSKGPRRGSDCAVITAFTILQLPPEYNRLLIVALQDKGRPVERLGPATALRHLKLRAAYG